MIASLDYHWAGMWNFFAREKRQWGLIHAKIDGQLFGLMQIGGHDGIWLDPKRTWKAFQRHSDLQDRKHERNLRRVSRVSDFGIHGAMLDFTFVRIDWFFPLGSKKDEDQISDRRIPSHSWVTLLLCVLDLYIIDAIADCCLHLIACDEQSQPGRTMIGCAPKGCSVGDFTKTELIKTIQTLIESKWNHASGHIFHAWLSNRSPFINVWSLRESLGEVEKQLKTLFPNKFAKLWKRAAAARNNTEPALNENWQETWPKLVSWLHHSFSLNIIKIQPHFCIFY